MAERNLTSLGTNINSLATQLMVMMPMAERTGLEASRSMMTVRMWRKKEEMIMTVRRKEGRKEVSS